MRQDLIIFPDLQLFSEAQISSGETSADPGQPTPRADAAHPDAQPQDAAAPRPSWEELMRDPYYNGKMRATIQGRLKEAKDSQAELQALAPALEMLTQRYGTPPGDHAALVTALQQEQQTSQRQQLQQHLADLHQQAQRLKQVFPDFDLKEKLRDPVFARLTAPGSGLTLEDAYYALHHRQLQEAAVQMAARQTAKAMRNALVSGSHRPQEHGTDPQAGSVAMFDYRKASPQARNALKDQIRLAAARGEKVYPG